MTHFRQALLTGGAILGAICLLAALGAVVLDVRPMIFRSGSMSPTIPAGALALVERVDGSDISRGDVVGVIVADGSRVTHRVVEVSVVDDVATLHMRGDANAVTDPAPYRVTQADRVLGAVPRIGYGIEWLTTGAGRLALAMYGAFLLFVIVRPTGPPRASGDRGGPAPGRRRAPKPRAPVRILGAAALVVLGGSLEVTHASDGWAAWSDAATVTGTTLGVHAVLPPTSVSCTGGGMLASLTYSWPSKDPRYTYRAELVDSTGTVLRTDLVPESSQGGGDYDVTYASDDLPPGDFAVRVGSFLTASTTWSSTSTASAAGSKDVNLTTACG